MPLRSFPGEQAFNNLRTNRNSLWPDGRRDRSRLSGVAQVGFDPSFQLLPGERVFTVGSCFARNIERRLAELGFDLPAMSLALPAEERASDTENDFLNKYPPHSILNEFRWALDPEALFPGNGFLPLRRELWHDPHAASNLKPASLDRVRKRREMVSSIYRQLPSCRIVVITLGLVEAWFDEEAGCYLNGAPPSEAAHSFPGRFRLDVLTPDEIYRCLVEIYQLLERFGHPNFHILLTVSPVPFKSTFTGRDAISANTYSKSALRAAAEMFVQAHGRADYFPSFEIVTHTVRSSAFIQDNRHVTPQLVNEIVDRVVEAYCPLLLDSNGDPSVGVRVVAAEIKAALKASDFSRAVQLFSRLEAKQRFERAGFEEFTYRYEYGRALLRSGAIAEAQAQLSQAVELRPNSADAAYQLGRALARLQRPIDAEEHFRRAVKLAPKSVDMRLSLANQLMELSRFDEAEVEIITVCDQKPDDTRLPDILQALRSRRMSFAGAEAAEDANPIRSKGPR